MIKLGIDRIPKIIDKYKGKNIGILTNATGINSQLDATVDIFIREGLNVIALFGPEHGIWGIAADGLRVENDIHPRYNIPIYSLYGKTEKPTEEMLRDIDIIFYDIQDTGLRFYTYIYTLANMMEECGKHNIDVIILDRPNPLSGKVRGPIIKDREFYSFVGGYNLALRYGLTPGELAIYYNDEFSMGVKLEIIPMEGWTHDMYYDDTGLFWNVPSPNIPTFEHNILYEGMCLFEGTNISLGRGTIHPFKYIGAPWINGYDLLREIRAKKHRGVAFRERDFIPYTSRYSGVPCHGIELFVEDKRSIKPLNIALDLISIIKDMYPDNFKWDTAYHEAKGRFHFDLLTGSDVFRKWIDQEKPIDIIWESWREDEKVFRDKIKNYWIYE